ncbi:hypothetical protein KJN74_05455, partial [Candidatus Bathyarchaeota archaeon]|nr:hypothetical protein [Candidatus Bathyarchaeota archaeon]
ADVVADVDALRTHLDSLLANSATDADVAAVSAAVDDLNSAVAQLDSDLQASIADAATKDDLDAGLDATQAELSDEMSESIGGLNTMVIVAVVLALIAAVAAILAVYIIQRKIAG